MSVCAILQTPGLAIQMQHSNFSHGGGEEVRCIQSGQEPRPKCPVEKHTQNVIPIEERACLQVPAELAARRGWRRSAQGVVDHPSGLVVRRSPSQKRRVALYVLGTWSENEYCVVVQLGIVDDDYDGRLCRRWGRLLCCLTSALSSPPASQKNCGRQRLSVSLADGERNTKGRPDVHPLG